MIVEVPSPTAMMLGLVSPSIGVHITAISSLEATTLPSEGTFVMTADSPGTISSDFVASSTSCGLQLPGAPSLSTLVTWKMNWATGSNGPSAGNPSPMMTCEAPGPTA